MAKAAKVKETRATELMTREEVAEALRVKPNTVATWHSLGRGPQLPVVRLHGKALYRRADVERLIEESTHGDDPKGRKARKLRSR